MARELAAERATNRRMHEEHAREMDALREQTKEEGARLRDEHFVSDTGFRVELYKRRQRIEQLKEQVKKMKSGGNMDSAQLGLD